MAAAILGVSGTSAAGSRFPVVFEVNHGQADSRVKFLSRGPGYTLFITAAEVILVDRHTDEPVRLRLLGGRQDPEIVGLEPLPGRSHYFIGRNPARWRTQVPTYARVAYREVYPGIDAVHKTDARSRIELEFLVQPSANPGAIRLEFDGVRSVAVDGTGDLVLTAEGSEVRLGRPIAYQEVGGTRHEIPSAWIVRGPREAGFRLGPYDHSHALVIDPVITWATYLGGSGSDQAFGVAVDAAGNTYVTGDTSSLNFPTTGGPTPAGGADAFVTKLDANGQALIYSTYIGGAGRDGGRAIALDTSGNAYVTGFTDSTDFPTTAGAFQGVHGGDLDGFVVKLDVTGAIAYATYLGGAAADVALGIAVDSGGRAHVAGGTRSSDFPTVSAMQPALGGGTCGMVPDTLPCRDAFVARLNALGTGLTYSTFLGGGSDDAANGIALDRSGNAYVTGFTMSANFPTTPGSLQPSPGGGLDAFVARVNVDGSLGWSTHLGGSGSDTANGIVVDGTGRPHVVGSTASANFPATGGDSFTGVTDGFVMKLDAAGGAIVWSRSTGSAVPTAVALDASANARLVANDVVCTTFLPTMPPACAESHVDVVVNKHSAGTGARLDFISFGGRANGAGGNDFGQAIAVRGTIVWVAGFTFATNFPTTVGVVQPTHQGETDAFVVKLTDPTTIPPIPDIPVSGFLPESGGGCLIATAAFGSPLAREVETLRRFRDRALLTNALGRLLVRTYYWLSPPLARMVAREPVLATAVRGVLRPIALGAELALDRPGVAMVLAGVGLTGILAAAVGARRNARRIRGGALAGLVVGAVLLAGVLALGLPEGTLPEPVQSPGSSPPQAPEAQPEPGVNKTLATSSLLSQHTPTRKREESGHALKTLATAAPLPPAWDTLLDFADIASHDASVRLLNPLAPRSARRWAVTSDLIEGVLGAEGFVVTDARLARGLGIEAGDTIVSIDAHPPSGLLAVMTALQRDPDRATVLLEIDRGGTRLSQSYRVR